MELRPRQLRFVDMPFGKKLDLASGTEIGNNLILLQEARTRRGQTSPEIDAVCTELEQRASELAGT